MRVRGAIYCPSCNQPIGNMRAGVRLPPLKAAIFDAIHAAGEIGISSRELIDTVYADRRRKPCCLTTMRMHVLQINDLLVETDTRIKPIQSRWIITKVKTKCAA